MKCEEARFLLRERFDGELSAAKRSILDRHLDTCSMCSDRMRVVQFVARSVAAVGNREAPAALLPRVRASVTEAAPTPSAYPGGHIQSRLWAPMLRRPAAALAAVAVLTACGYTLLDRVVDLNRTGKWSEAARAGEKLAAAPGRPDPERCGATISAAYARARLHEREEAKRLLDAYDASCSGLEAAHWTRTERDNLAAELSPGTPDWKLNRGLELNKTGRWEEAAALFAALVESAGTTLAQRCEAMTGLAYARLRGGNRAGAGEAATSFDRQCSALPKDHWLRPERSRLGKEFSRKR